MQVFCFRKYSDILNLKAREENAPMSASTTHIHCQDCNFSHLCLPLALRNDELETLDSIVKRNRPLHKNDLLVEAHSPMTSLYAVRTGAFKSYIVDSNGDYQITGFHLPGDIIGLDGIGARKHVSTTQALETAMVCEIPTNLLDEVSQSIPTLRKQLMQFMSSEIQTDREMMMLLNKRNAESRLMYFLLLLSKRFEVRGFSPSTFLLSMTRTDIGNYLGLTVETVSRLLTKFQKAEYIKVDGKSVTLVNREAMEKKLEEFQVNLPRVG
jgi:CRP/FNR family transcriptional regulator